MSSPEPAAEATPPTALTAARQPLSRRDLARLLVLFGTLYFVQGVIEPTANLPYQPLVSQFGRWGFSTGEVGRFLAIIGIAWSIKPLFGLVSDFLPIAGRRRWPYLVFSTTLAANAFLILAWWWNPRIAGGRVTDWGTWLLAGSPLSTAGWLMIAAGIGIAMSDVVIDALAIEVGQPRGLTGQFQAVQWGAMSAVMSWLPAMGPSSSLGSSPSR